MSICLQIFLSQFVTIGGYINSSAFKNDTVTTKIHLDTFLSRFLKICIFLEGLKQSSIFVKCLTFSMGVVKGTADNSYS